MSTLPDSDNVPADAPIFRHVAMEVAKLGIRLSGDVLGRGTYGIVYCGFFDNVSSNRPTKVAVKCIHSFSDGVQVRSEATIQALVAMHSGGLPLLHIGNFPFGIVLITPFVENSNFRSLAESGTLGDARRYIRALLLDLLRFSEAGIIHRDIKPKNFLYNIRTGLGWLTDYGLAEYEENRLYHAVRYLYASENSACKVYDSNNSTSSRYGSSSNRLNQGVLDPRRTKSIDTPFPLGQNTQSNLVSNSPFSLNSSLSSHSQVGNNSSITSNQLSDHQNMKKQKISVKDFEELEDARRARDLFLSESTNEGMGILADIANCMTSVIDVCASKGFEAVNSAVEVREYNRKLQSMGFNESEIEAQFSSIIESSLTDNDLEAAHSNSSNQVSNSSVVDPSEESVRCSPFSTTSAPGGVALGSANSHSGCSSSVSPLSSTSTSKESSEKEDLEFEKILAMYNHIEEAELSDIKRDPLQAKEHGRTNRVWLADENAEDFVEAGGFTPLHAFTNTSGLGTGMLRSSTSGSVSSQSVSLTEPSVSPVSGGPHAVVPVPVGEKLKEEKMKEDKEFVGEKSARARQDLGRAEVTSASSLWRQGILSSTSSGLGAVGPLHPFGVLGLSNSLSNSMSNSMSGGNGGIGQEPQFLPTQHGDHSGTAGFRAPEVLLNSPLQTPAIDAWAVGVALLSLLTRRYPLFPGRDDAEHLLLILQVLGKLSPYALSVAGKTLVHEPAVGRSDHFWSRFVSCGGGVSSLFIRERRVFDSDFRIGLSLAVALLHPNPAERLGPREALLHPFLCVKTAALWPLPPVFSPIKWRMATWRRYLLSLPGNTVKGSSNEHPLNSSTSTEKDEVRKVDLMDDEDEETKEWSKEKWEWESDEEDSSDEESSTLELNAIPALPERPIPPVIQVDTPTSVQSDSLSRTDVLTPVPLASRPADLRPREPALSVEHLEREDMVTPIPVDKFGSALSIFPQNPGAALSSAAMSPPLAVAESPIRQKNSALHRTGPQPHVAVDFSPSRMHTSSLFSALNHPRPSPQRAGVAPSLTPQSPQHSHHSAHPLESSPERSAPINAGEDGVEQDLQGERIVERLLEKVFIPPSHSKQDWQRPETPSTPSKRAIAANSNTAANSNFSTSITKSPVSVHPTFTPNRISSSGTLQPSPNVSNRNHAAVALSFTSPQRTRRTQEELTPSRVRSAARSLLATLGPSEQDDTVEITPRRMSGTVQSATDHSKHLEKQSFAPPVDVDPIHAAIASNPALEVQLSSIGLGRADPELEGAALQEARNEREDVEDVVDEGGEGEDEETAYFGARASQSTILLSLTNPNSQTAISTTIAQDSDFVSDEEEKKVISSTPT